MLISIDDEKALDKIPTAFHDKNTQTKNRRKRLQFYRGYL